MGKKRRNDSDANTQLKVPQNEYELINDEAQNTKKKLQKKKEAHKTKEIPTISIALPGSIIDNTQSYELATRVCFFFFYLLFLSLLWNYTELGIPAFSLTTQRWKLYFFFKTPMFYIYWFFIVFLFFFQLAGQIARAATIFRINEVAVCINYSKMIHFFNDYIYVVLYHLSA